MTFVRLKPGNIATYEHNYETAIALYKNAIWSLYGSSPHVSIQFIQPRLFSTAIAFRDPKLRARIEYLIRDPGGDYVLQVRAGPDIGGLIEEHLKEFPERKKNYDVILSKILDWIRDHSEMGLNILESVVEILDVVYEERVLSWNKEEIGKEFLIEGKDKSLQRLFGFGYVQEALLNMNIRLGKIKHEECFHGCAVSCKNRIFIICIV
ncbi:MAG TPA: hypothetical protein EYP78_06695 [Candidatus Omnitrophica bacterium]|nr:hypothetical protein [Candidatus Omnitrophota bacterium]